MNEIRGFPEWSKLRGQGVPLEELARLDRLARRVELLGAVGGEGTQATADEGGLSLLMPPEPSGWGLITGFGPVSGSYTFTELQGDGGFPRELITTDGSYQGVAYEVTRDPLVPVGETVRVWRGDGEHWEFKYAPSEMRLQPTVGQPTDSAPPGVIRYDVTVQGGGGGGGGGNTVLWVSLGAGLWVPVCLCPGATLPSGSGSGSGGGAGSGTIAAACAPGLYLPDTLYGFVSGATGPGCNGEYVLKYPPPPGSTFPSPVWTTNSTGAGPDTYGECAGSAFVLYCDGTTWRLSGQYVGLGTGLPAATYTGNPFQLTFNLTDGCGCGPATMTIIR